MRDGPLNMYFDQAGFKSLQAIKNLGSTYLFLMVDAVTLVGLGLAWAVKRAIHR
jgi:hypothetical protein